MCTYGGGRDGVLFEGALTISRYQTSVFKTRNKKKKNYGIPPFFENNATEREIVRHVLTEIHDLQFHRVETQRGFHHEII